MAAATYDVFKKKERNQRLDRAVNGKDLDMIEETAEAAPKKKKSTPVFLKAPSGTSAVADLLNLYYNRREQVAELLGIAVSTVGRYANDPELTALAVHNLALILIERRKSELSGKKGHRFDGLPHKDILDLIREDMLEAEERGLSDWSIEDGMLSAVGTRVVKERL